MAATVVGIFFIHALFVAFERLARRGHRPQRVAPAMEPDAVHAATSAE